MSRLTEETVSVYKNVDRVVKNIWKGLKVPDEMNLSNPDTLEGGIIVTWEELGGRLSNFENENWKSALSLASEVKAAHQAFTIWKKWPYLIS